MSKGTAWTIGLAVAFVVARTAVPVVRNYFASPGDRAVRSAVHAMPSSQVAEFKAHFDSRGISSSADRERESARLAAVGMVRLSDADLRLRAAMLRKVVDRLPVSDCAMVTRQGAGHLGTAGLASILNRPGEMDEFMRLAFRAMLAEMRATPPVIPVSEDDTNDAMIALVETVSPDDQTRFYQALTNLKTSADEEACWAGRITFAAVESIPEPGASHLARLLAKSP